MDTSSYFEEYKTLLEPDLVVASRARSKVKGHSYPFREVTDLVITNHARARMQQRQVSDQDIALILHHGRALLRQKNNKSVVQIFLCPGELPKGKAEEKSFEKLWGVVLVTTPHEPVLITILTECFRWRNYIFRKPNSPGKAINHLHKEQGI